MTTENTSDQHGISTDTAVPPRAAIPTAPQWGKVGNQIKATASRIPANQDRAEWGDAKAVRARFGICKSTTTRLANDGKILGCSLRERGKLRGKKLYSMDSVAAYIERMAARGEEEP